VGNPEKEPLCTLKELLVFGVICVVYCSILFSLDPEWVAWAAPLAFGGSLYAADPPPASLHLTSPQHALVLGYLYAVLSLLALVLLGLVRDNRHLKWLTWLKTGTTTESIAKARRLLRSKITLTSGR